MIEPTLIALMVVLAASGLAVAGLWTVTFCQAAGRRQLHTRSVVQTGGEKHGSGAGRVMLGAAAGVAMGVVLGCSGCLGATAAAGNNVNVPDEFGLFLLAIPVGLILCPGLVLWGLVMAWRAAERDPDGLGPAPAAPVSPTDGGEIDPLDAPFDPPPVDRRRDG